MTSSVVPVATRATYCSITSRIFSGLAAISTPQEIEHVLVLVRRERSGLDERDGPQRQMAPPGQPRGPRRARGGVRRPEPRLPRHPAPDRGPRPARRAGRQRCGVRPHAGAAGRVVPRRGLRRRARRRGALGRLGRGRPGHRGAGADRVRGGPAGPAHRDAHARRRRRQRLRALRRRPRHPRRAARALRRVRRRGPPRVRPPRGRRVLRRPGRRAQGAGRQAPPVPHGLRAGAVGGGGPGQPRAGAGGA